MNLLAFVAAVSLCAFGGHTGTGIILIASNAGTADEEYTLVNIVAHPLWYTIYPNVEPLKELRGLPKCARTIKAFVYDLPVAYNSELLDFKENSYQHINNNKCDFLRTPCAETGFHPMWGTKEDGAEVPLLSKLLLLPRTTNPKDADIFVVPFFGATARYNYGLPDLRGRRLSQESYAELVYVKMMELLVHFTGDMRKRHIIIMTRDQPQINFTAFPEAIVAHHGPKLEYGSKREIPVPASFGAFGIKTNPLKRPIHFLYFMAGIMNPERVWWFKHLTEMSQRHKHLNMYVKELEGRHFLVTGNDTVNLMSSSLLCPLPLGDTAYAHRLYDTILSGCVPLVILFKVNTEHGECLSHYSRNPAECCMQDFYPFYGHIDWRSMMVEVPEEIYHDTGAGTLESFLLGLDMKELQAKRELVLKTRHLLDYDWSGEAPDAFSMFLAQVCDAIE